MTKQSILQFALGIGTFIALRYFGMMSDWPNIPVTGRISLPVSGETLQVILSGAAAYVPNVLGSFQWIEDAVAMPGRVRELHAVKGQLLSGASAATALGNTATVKPIEAEKPE